MKEITEQEMSNIISAWTEKSSSIPKEVFYCFDNKTDVWVGCDNSTGDCWVEEFKTKDDLMKWINDY